MEFFEYSIGFSQDTLDKIERLHVLLGGDNKANTIAKGIAISLEVCETLRNGGSVSIISPEGKHTELRLDASVLTSDVNTEVGKGFPEA